MVAQAADLRWWPTALRCRCIALRCGLASVAYKVFLYLFFLEFFRHAFFCFSSTASKDDHADAGVCPMRTKCDLITVVISVPHVFTTSTISYIGFAISQFTEKAISSANTKHYRCWYEMSSKIASATLATYSFQQVNVTIWENTLLMNCVIIYLTLTRWRYASTPDIARWKSWKNNSKTLKT